MNQTRVNVTLPASVFEALRLEAFKQKIQPGTLVRLIVNRYVQKLKPAVVK